LVARIAKIIKTRAELQKFRDHFVVFRESPRHPWKFGLAKSKLSEDKNGVYLTVRLRNKKRTYFASVRLRLGYEGKHIVHKDKTKRKLAAQKRKSRA